MRTSMPSRRGEADSWVIEHERDQDSCRRARGSPCIMLAARGDRRTTVRDFPRFIRDLDLVVVKDHKGAECTIRLIAVA